MSRTQTTVQREAVTNHRSELDNLLERPVGRIAMQDGQMVPTDFEGVERIATWLFEEKVVPESVKSIGQAMAIVGYGMSIGLTALASLRSVMLVRGIPTVWGDAALALVRKSPLCVGVKESFEHDQNPDNWRATCEVIRATRLPDGTFREETIAYSFSVSDAKKAGLWGKPGPWVQHPKRMLKYRARAFCLRDAFPDVLGGLYITEEFEGEPDQDAPVVARAQASPARGAAALASRLSTAKAPESVDTTAEPTPDPEDVEPAPEPAPAATPPTTTRGRKAPIEIKEGDIAF